MKREIDALQVQAMHEARPWYKQLPVLVSLVVSVAALGFSFWTDYKSGVRLDRQEEHEARAELRSLIQRMQVLPKENFELYRTYADDPLAQRTLGPLLNTENIVLGRQAADLIEELEGEVGAVEYYATAYALALSDQPVAASELITEGLKVAEDPVNETALLRQDAAIRFSLGDLEGGRRRWQQALEIFDKYPEQNRNFVLATYLFTETSWADAERSQGKCREARAHIAAAEEYISDLPATHPMIAQRAQVEATIEDECGRSPST